jgi:hypothetical protein
MIEDRQKEFSEHLRRVTFLMLSHFCSGVKVTEESNLNCSLFNTL